MKIKVANYIAQFLVDHGIDHAFTVTGGGAMHLNDALGHQAGLTCIYNHHEQACAIAAEAYARIDNRIAALCVTTGPGGTNAITGVVGGWLDSIPMLVVSGQVRYDTTARSTDLPLRAMGDQEFDICQAVACMTKYCEMITEPRRIRWCLERAYHLATTGRQGPCWLDIPLNVQGSFVETDELEAYDPAQDDKELPPPPSDETIDTILDRIAAAERPVLYGGNGIRLSGGFAVFERVKKLLGAPIATGWNSIDLISNDDPLYVGRGGIMGDRAGNFAVQNADVLLTIGNRLSIRQVGYNWRTWAREAFVIMCDVDKVEMQKPTLHVEMPVWTDARQLLEAMERRLLERGHTAQSPFSQCVAWRHTCQEWKARYPVVMPKHYDQRGNANIYAFFGRLGDACPPGQTIVVGNGSACVVGSHGMCIKDGQRFIINSAIASMGYDLPAAIGSCVAEHGEQIILVTGDGSIQMNLQELQTIVHHQMPIKTFVINNQGYHSIRQTQTNLFDARFVGIGPDSHDLSFPSLEKLACAYGYPYIACRTNKQLASAIAQTLATDGPVLCEVFVDTQQFFEPKSATKRLEDGALVSPPLEDLAPFLPREELEKNMFISLIPDRMDE